MFMDVAHRLSSWSEETPPLERLCALLKTSDFWGAESGTRYATYHLENHPDLQPALRFKLAREYHIERWARRAFRELMDSSILEVSVEDEATMGWDAYRALGRTQAEVQQHRISLALFPPDAVHALACYDHNGCNEIWAHNWVGISGGLGRLLKDEMTGLEMHDALANMEVPGMRAECRIQTIESIQDTPTVKSLLKKEEDYIEEAVAALIKQW